MRQERKTFIIKELLPCWVSYSYRVQAENEEEAIEAYYNSQAECVGKEVVETIGWLDHSGLEVIAEQTERRQP
jgi:hypothetical protein